MFQGDVGIRLCRCWGCHAVVSGPGGQCLEVVGGPARPQAAGAAGIGAEHAPPCSASGRTRDSFSLPSPEPTALPSIKHQTACSSPSSARYRKRNSAFDKTICAYFKKLLCVI